MESVTIKRLIDNLCHLLANEVPCPGRYPYHQANSQSHPSNWSMLAFKITKMITLGLMTLRTDLMKLFSSPSSTSARYPPTCAVERVVARWKFQINTAQWFYGVFLCIELTYDFYFVNLSLLGAIWAIFQFCGFSGLFWPFSLVK